MPLLLCPNDNGPMQTVQRSGVEFDMCPNCRGVWLDRGELEKLLAAARDPAPSDTRSQHPSRNDPGPMQSPPRQDPRRDWDDDDDYRRHKRRPSIFDIFD